MVTAYVLPTAKAAAPVPVAGFGLPYPRDPGDPLLGQVPINQAGVPQGGLTGQALVKGSSADYDGAWGTPGASAITLNHRTSSYTVASTDVDGNTWLEMDTTGPCNLILPASLPLNKTVLFSQLGAGQVTVTAATTAVTLLGSPVTTRAQYSCCGIFQRTTGQWYLFGDFG